MSKISIESLFVRREAGSGPLPKRLWGKLTSRIASLLIELHPATSGCGPCRNRMLSLASRVRPTPEAPVSSNFAGAAPGGLGPSFPVDVVFTWVNGADPAHAKKRAEFLPRQEEVHVNGLEHARFRDNEELRYSLRALERYAPWVRRIILVTDAQTPAWLDASHEKIRIVDHKEFIPERYLPTFNSHVIEAFLHRIPGLAEHYMYLNDDVFLARPCGKTEFFTLNGLPLAFVDWRGRRLSGYKFTKTPHAQSYFNTLRILDERGVATDPKFITAHGPYPQTVSNAADAFEFYRDVIEGFASNRFRTANEIAMYSHALPLWIYHKKRLVPCDERYYYVQTARRDRLAYYKAILHSKADYAAPLFFCINDVGDHSGSALWREDMHTLLSTYYPAPSPFERASAPAFAARSGNV